MNNWDFLDEFNKNLLYEYALSLSHKKGFQHPETAIEVKRQTYYLLWFVYRHILGCKTYEDTIPYQTKAVLEKYHLQGRLSKGMSLGYLDLGDKYGMLLYTNETSETPYMVGFFLNSIYSRLSVTGEARLYFSKYKSASKRAQLDALVENIEKTERGLLCQQRET
jgi:hypothetical protein